MKKVLGFIVISLGIIGFIFASKNDSPIAKTTPTDTNTLASESPVPQHPLAIESMRQKSYPGSDLVIESELTPGSNYRRYLTSYQSEGLKIYALLTIPNSEEPEDGWPAIVFNHGYIPPAVYRTTERYGAYTDAFSKNGYVLLKPDYRGHGESEGNPEGGYYSPAYTTDVLNAVSSLKKHPAVNPSLLGMWGHSMGGHLTLRSMVTTNDVKVGVIWAGVVASYPDMATNWRRSRPWQPSQSEQAFRRPSRQELIEAYGEISEDNPFWSAISPINFVKDVSGPIQIHHGTNDADVPILFSERLKTMLDANGKIVDYYSYQGDDHNLSQNLSVALNRSVNFFDQYLKAQL